MIRSVTVAAIAFTVSVAAQGPAPAALTFEVASIKPAPTERPVGPGAFPRRSPDRLDLPNATVRSLIGDAYGVRESLIFEGPAWIASDRWSVSAKAPRVATPAEMRTMMQRLLEERLALKAHRETRDLPTYHLVLARRDGQLGAQVKPAAVDCEPFRTAQRPIGDAPLKANAASACAMQVRWGTGVTTRYFPDTTMLQLASSLETNANRVIIDKTGLSGRYDIEVTYEDSTWPLLPGAKRREGPALLTAVQEQMGLKLESSRAPVEVLIIDSIEHPGPD